MAIKPSDNTPFKVPRKMGKSGGTGRGKKNDPPTPKIEKTVEPETVEVRPKPEDYPPMPDVPDVSIDASKSEDAPEVEATQAVPQDVPGEQDTPDIGVDDARYDDEEYPPMPDVPDVRGADTVEDEAGPATGTVVTGVTFKKTPNGFEPVRGSETTGGTDSTDVVKKIDEMYDWIKDIKLKLENGDYFRIQ